MQRVSSIRYVSDIPTLLVHVDLCLVPDAPEIQNCQPEHADPPLLYSNRFYSVAANRDGFYSL